MLHGIPVAKLKGENTDEIVKEFMNTNLGIKLNDLDIDRSHRLVRTGLIIIKFSLHNTKQLVYVNKKKLKGKTFLITESLTAKRK